MAVESVPAKPLQVAFPSFVTNDMRRLVVA